MKANKRDLISLNVTSNEHINGKDFDKIELISCPLLEEECRIHLREFNKSFSESNHYRVEKDFFRSIDTLKIAYYKTNDLNTKHPCSGCARFYRSTIIESLENLKDELTKMTSGFWGNKHYQVSLLKVNKTIQELQTQV